MTPEHRLHPQAEAYRRELHAVGARPLHELSVAEARKAELADLEQTSPEPVASVVDLEVPGPEGDVPVRLYRPDAAHPLPVLLYFVGGGWVLGSPAASDPVCRRLANVTPCAVASVGYRRAPENPFPAGLEDCYAALCWMAVHGAELGVDPAQLAAGGASAGGNLAAAVALLAREREGPRLALQVLVYPPLDHCADTPSMAEALDPLFFGREDLAWCWSHYLVDPADGDNPLASPLRARDLRGLPPALVISAELDPLSDQAELYAARLCEAGVPVDHRRFEGVPHGFFSKADRFDAGAEAQELVASALRLAFAASPRAREDSNP
jgi:acetyl esterase